LKNEQNLFIHLFIHPFCWGLNNTLVQHLPLHPFFLQEKKDRRVVKKLEGNEDDIDALLAR